MQYSHTYSTSKILSTELQNVDDMYVVALQCIHAYKAKSYTRSNNMSTLFIQFAFEDELHFLPLGKRKAGEIGGLNTSRRHYLTFCIAHTQQHI